MPTSTAEGTEHAIRAWFASTRAYEPAGAQSVLGRAEQNVRTCRCVLTHLMAFAAA
jgi:hypothetical protein